MPDQSSDLYVFLHGERVGTLVSLRRGTVHLHYGSAPPKSPPLSLSLRADNQDRLDVSAWLDGMLPENPRIRSRWARELGARSTAPFDLLCTEAGLEGGGAIQFCSRPKLPDPEPGALKRLTDAELAARLRVLSQDADEDPGVGLGGLRLSLPGAQPKLALTSTGDGWHLASGSLATTHILKPQRGHLNTAVRGSIAVNEHLCQTSASVLGLNAARTSLAVFDGETTLVVERFDREVTRGTARRLHFEDLCQAMGVPTAYKYQVDGGPSPETVIEFLRDETARVSVREFFLAMFYNWLIGNLDGHTKNYGVLLDESPPNLSPLFDLSSFAPYASADSTLVPTAMRFAGRQPATLQDWAQIADRLRVGVTGFALRDMADGLPDAFEQAAAQCPAWACATAESVCESVVSYAALRSRTDPVDGFEAAPGVVAPSTTDMETCGRQVMSTAKPCLLHPNHRGNCRSVL